MLTMYSKIVTLLSKDVARFLLMLNSLLVLSIILQQGQVIGGTASERITLLV